MSGMSIKDRMALLAASLKEKEQKFKALLAKGEEQAMADVTASLNPNEGEGDNVNRASVDQPIDQSSKGFQMLRKIGWSDDSGLGKDGSGRVEPVQVTDYGSSREGLGHREETEARVAPGTFTRKLLETEREETPEVSRRRQESRSIQESRARDVQELLKDFYCEDCDKQYRTIGQYEEHLNSMSHAHIVRMKETKERLRRFNPARSNEEDNFSSALKRASAVSAPPPPPPPPPGAPSSSTTAPSAPSNVSTTFSLASPSTSKPSAQPSKSSLFTLEENPAEAVRPLKRGRALSSTSAVAAETALAVENAGPAAKRARHGEGPTDPSSLTKEEILDPTYFPYASDAPLLPSAKLALSKSPDYLIEQARAARPPPSKNKPKTEILTSLITQLTAPGAHLFQDVLEKTLPTIAKASNSRSRSRSRSPPRRNRRRSRSRSRSRSPPHRHDRDRDRRPYRRSRSRSRSRSPHYRRR